MGELPGCSVALGLRSGSLSSFLECALPGCNLTPGSPPASPLPAGLFIVDKPWHNGQHPGLTQGWKPGQQHPPSPRHGAPTQATVFTPNSRPRVTGQRRVSPSLPACVKDVIAMTKATPVPLPHTSVLPAPSQHPPRGPGRPAAHPREAGYLSVHLQFPPTPSSSSEAWRVCFSLGVWTPVSLSALRPLPRDSKHFQTRELPVETERAQEESWGTRGPGARGWGSWFPATQLTWPRVGMMSPGEDFLEEEVD